MSTTPTPTSLVYTRDELAAALKIGLTSLAKMRNEDPTFPAPVRFAGPGDRPKWVKAQVEAWLVSKTAQEAKGERA